MKVQVVVTKNQFKISVNELRRFSSILNFSIIFSSARLEKS